MIRNVCLFLAAVSLLALTLQPASARPEYLARFKSDPFRRSNMDNCAVCHVNPNGGGTRNEFGSAFEAGGKILTPMLRVNFPDRFEVQTLRMSDGSVFYFADPENQFVVLKRKEEKFLIDLNAVTRLEKEKDKIPPPDNRMTFFITSQGLGNGGHLGGLAGADRHCQALAEAAGAGDRTWHAYLSTRFEDGPGINAGDRIGSGPWYNANGALIAHGVSELHDGNRLNLQNGLDEKGKPVAAGHDVLTGSLPNGKAAPGMDCQNWTSSADGKAMVGHFDGQSDADGGNSWNSAHPTRSCSQESLRSTGNSGLLYCFAVRK